MTGGDGTQYLYVIDRTGVATKVGTVKVENGKATIIAKTSLDSFMLAVSPEDNLKVIGPDTKVSLITRAPSGFTFSQQSSVGSQSKAVTGDVAATGSGGDVGYSPKYNAPTLSIADFQLDMETKLRLIFWELTSVSGAAFIRPRSDGAAIRIVIYIPTGTPAGIHYVLWAVTADQTYTRLGQAVTTEQGSDLLIAADTPLKSFGLFMTTETGGVPSLPSGPKVATVTK